MNFSFYYCPKYAMLSQTQEHMDDEIKMRTCTQSQQQKYSKPNINNILMPKIGSNFTLWLLWPVTLSWYLAAHGTCWHVCYLALVLGSTVSIGLYVHPTNLSSLRQKSMQSFFTKFAMNLNHSISLNLITEYKIFNETGYYLYKFSS